VTRGAWLRLTIGLRLRPPGGGLRPNRPDREGVGEAVGGLGEAAGVTCGVPAGSEPKNVIGQRRSWVKG